MAKKSYRKSGSNKRASPVPSAMVEPAPAAAGPLGKGLIFYARLIFILAILLFAGNTFWDFIPHQQAPSAVPKARNPAAGNAAVPQAAIPAADNAATRPESKAKRMNMTLEFDGIKSKWGYSGWAIDGSANPNLNKGIMGTPLRILNTEYKQGIGTHAPSEIVFSLDGKVERFSCLVGPDVGGGSSDIIVFKVLGDDKKLYESPVMRGGNVEALPVDLDVSGVKELNLKVVFGGTEQGWGHADWINVKFKR